MMIKVWVLVCLETEFCVFRFCSLFIADRNSGMVLPKKLVPRGYAKRIPQCFELWMTTIEIVFGLGWAL
jgi:hypothetical protein